MLDGQSNNRQRMPTRLATRIQECFDALTPSERALASYILENPNGVVGLSAAELSRAAGTSKSTTVRFFRALGYESFEAVRLQVRAELNHHQPNGWSGRRPESARAGSPEAYVADELTALARTHESLNSETLRAVVERLAVADRIWLLTLDDDAPLAALAEGLFLSVRDNVHILADGRTSLLVRLASVGPKDVLLVIALGHRSAEAKFAIEQVASAGAGLVVLTNTSLPSPLGADLVIRCHASSGMPGGSLTAAISTLQFVVRRLAERLGARAASRKALIERLRDAARNRG